MRRLAVSAEKGVQHLEDKPRLEHELRAGAGIAHRHRLPGRKRAAALRLVVGKALDRERLGPGAQILAQQPLEGTLERLGQPRAQMLQRDEVAERIQVGRPQRRRVFRAGSGAFPPFGRAV